MYLKFLIGLALAIVVGALFTNNIGDGFFKFQKKGKATKMADTLRDISGIMQTYQTDDSGLRSPFTVADADNDNVVPYVDLITELNQDDLVRGDGSINIGNMLVGESTGGDVFLVVDSTSVVDPTAPITEDMCDIFNEVMEVPGATADLSTLTVTGTGNTATIDTTNVDALVTAAPLIANGDTEGVCVKDSAAGSDNHAIIFFVQRG